MTFNFFHCAFIVCACMWFMGCKNISQPTSSQRESPAVFTHIIPATHPAITTMGRTQIEGDTQRFGFPGVSFFIDAQGTELRATLSSTSDISWVDVIVDDGEPQLIRVPQTPTSVVLFNNLSDTAHRVRITHRTENWQGQVTLHSLELLGTGFLSAPQLPDKKLLIFGDSVTCGEAIDREENAPKTSRWWNARESYGLLTAQQLNAQVHLVCWGGRGLVRSWNGVTTDGNLPEFSSLTRGEVVENQRWNPANYQPDVIVSAIGTNDFSQGIPEKTEYVRAYVSFLRQVLKDYPQATLLLIEGSILNGEKKAALVAYLKEVVKEVNDPRVRQGSSPYHPGSLVDAHPTKAQHNDMAAHLAAQLASFFDN